MLEAILTALLKELMTKYPGLAWASILVQIQHLGDDALKALEEWWKMEMPEPWPGMPPMPLPHPQGPPTDDPFKP